ncbi:MAG: heavy metal translocating P-type ATPase metal-binding domain-containing protein [Halioglobus sp.]
MNAITEGRFASQAAQCFHCGEPVPDGCDISIVIDGKSRPMCCPGCRAVASLISGSGLSNFYRRRTAFNSAPSRSTMYQKTPGRALRSGFTTIRSSQPPSARAMTRTWCMPGC